jgi:hypothetical protein
MTLTVAPNVTGEQKLRVISGGRNRLEAQLVAACFTPTASIAPEILELSRALARRGILRSVSERCESEHALAQLPAGGRPHSPSKS